MPQYQNNLQDRRIENLEKQMFQVQEHISVTNSEIGTVKTDVAWLKEAVKKIDDRTWLILATIIIGFLVQIILNI